MNKYGWQLMTILVQFISLISNGVLCGINEVNISHMLIYLINIVM